jgi:hypothetical protein
MPRSVYVVYSRPSDPSREDEYNDWYDNTHVPQVLAVPGFVSARRHRLTEWSAKRLEDVPGPVYLAVYELDTDDPAEAVRELGRRMKSGDVVMTDAIAAVREPPPGPMLYDAVSSFG